MNARNFQVKLVFYLSSTFFICMMIVDVRAQANNSITGFVFGIERTPVSDISVELSDDTYSLISRVKTDGSGRYIFSRLRRGRYYLRVLPLGTSYEGQNKDVEIAGISRTVGSDTIQQNFYLQLKSQGSNNLPAITGIVFAQEIPNEAQKLYEKALSDLKDKKTDLGLAKLENALKIFPTYYLALDKLGQEYITQEKYQEAYDVLIKAVEINPGGFSSQYALGYSLYQLKKYQEALEVIRKSIEIIPNSINSFFLVGVCLKQLGNYKEAVENLKKANKLSNSKQADVHWQLSLIYTNNLKRYADAATELEFFLKIKPDYREAEKVRELIKKLKAKAKE